MRGKFPFVTAEDFEEKVHDLATNSKNVLFLTSHAKQRKKERAVTSRQILDVLRNGKVISGPRLDEHGDYRVKLKKFSAGHDVQVVVAVGKDKLVVVTVIRKL